MQELIASIIAWCITFVAQLFLVVAISAFIAIFVMLLWNWLVPVIFGLKAISFLQAWGLMILCNIMFKIKVSMNKK